MRKVVFFAVIAAILTATGIGIFGLQSGQAQARALCREQGQTTLEDTRALLAGKQRKITLEKVDDLFERLNEARTCMGKRQRHEANALSMRLGRERAIILFQQPHCTATNLPVEGCRSSGWPADRPVPRQRQVHNTGL